MSCGLKTKQDTCRADRSKYNINILAEKHRQRAERAVLGRTTVDSVISHHVSDASET